ncbi:hypothetical protein ACFU9B_42200 [Streptomyces sp. NPDC057592]|uniref:hypothetical protein n=1 Tax=unclassified Streptomyces TaxID=2593676 RepID=UPI0036A98F76
MEYKPELIAQVVRDYRATVLPCFEERDDKRGRQAAEALMKRWGPGPVRAAIQFLQTDLSLDH